VGELVSYWSVCAPAQSALPCVMLIWDLRLQLGGAPAVRLTAARRRRRHQAPQVHTRVPPPSRAGWGRRWRWQRPGGPQGRHEWLQLLRQPTFLFLLLLHSLLLLRKAERALQHRGSNGGGAAQRAARWGVGGRAGSSQPGEGADTGVEGL